ncbi:MAG: hypothetical protein HY698_20330 [Deltaproteobacteria bacterium]|nr:hypothetical protein [Deltaproteobacteria bacterium]
MRTPSIALILLVTSCQASCCPTPSRETRPGLGAPVPQESPVSPPSAPSQLEEEPSPEPTSPAVDRALVVPKEHPLYARVEGEGFRNQCDGDADCKVGGCSSEICSAEAGVMSACDVLDFSVKGSSCGCVAGTCAWYKAGPGTAQAPAAVLPELPSQGMPCPAGRCAEGLTCIMYHGIAGPKGPTFTSCEIPCPLKESMCPQGQGCFTIADGPGRVCRPAR